MAEPARYRLVEDPDLPRGVVLAEPRARFVLRGDVNALRACGSVLGVTPSDVACRAVRAEPWTALWLGPDEQLLLGPEDQSANNHAALQSALAPYPHSLVDVSHRQIGLTITGTEAQDLLAAGCPLDLDLAVFPVDMCTRTVFAKAEIVLWRTCEQQFHVEVWRSYANYLVGWLRAASLNH
jgi:sarcosine oxidase, subunit gamma